MTRSAQLFEEAKRYIPGGVNSPVRAFAAIGSCPRFIAKADGAYLTDADGNRYIDYVCSWGPMILGHNRREIREAVTEAAARGLSYGAATEIEVEMARMVCGMVPQGKAGASLLCRPAWPPTRCGGEPKKAGFFVISSGLPGLCPRRDCGIMGGQRTRFVEAMGFHRVIPSAGMTGFSPAEDCHEHQGPDPVSN